MKTIPLLFIRDSFRFSRWLCIRSICFMAFWWEYSDFDHSSTGSKELEVQWKLILLYIYYVYKVWIFWKYTIVYTCIYIYRYIYAPTFKEILSIYWYLLWNSCFIFFPFFVLFSILRHCLLGSSLAKRHAGLIACL